MKGLGHGELKPTASDQVTKERWHQQPPWDSHCSHGHHATKTALTEHRSPSCHCDQVSAPPENPVFRRDGREGASISKAIDSVWTRKGRTGEVGGQERQGRIQLLEQNHIILQNSSWTNIHTFIKFLDWCESIGNLAIYRWVGPQKAPGIIQQILGRRFEKGGKLEHGWRVWRNSRVLKASQFLAL